MLTHLDDDDVEQRILLADFGIARNVDDISGLTATNMTVGTVAYAAPEQLMGQELDGRADQYALAATAYHLLTGSLLFPHSNPAVVISRHLTSAPPALADTHPYLAALDPVLATALAKNRADRFTLCAEFARALAEQAVPKATISGAVTRPARASRKAAGHSPNQTTARGSRRWWLLAAVTLAVVLLASAVALAWRPWERGRSTATTTSAQPPAAPSSSSAPSPRPAPPPPPPSAVFPASAIDTVLLTPAEINTLAASPADPLMQIRQTTHGMLNNSNLVTPSSCVGVIFTGERAVFADTGFEAMLNQTLEPSGGIAYNAKELTQVEQSVVIYPKPEQAQTVLSSSRRQWQSCATGRVRLGTVGQNGENTLTFDLGPVQLHGDLLAVSMVANSQESGGSACQQVMAVRANVVVAVRACRYPEPPPGELNADVSSVRKDAEPLASAMIDKITV